MDEVDRRVRGPGRKSVEEQVGVVPREVRGVRDRVIRPQLRIGAVTGVGGVHPPGKHGEDDGSAGHRAGARGGRRRSAQRGQEGGGEGGARPIVQCQLLVVPVDRRGERLRRRHPLGHHQGVDPPPGVVVAAVVAMYVRGAPLHLGQVEGVARPEFVLDRGGGCRGGSAAFFFGRRRRRCDGALFEERKNFAPPTLPAATDGDDLESLLRETAGDGLALTAHNNIEQGSLGAYYYQGMPVDEIVHSC